MCFIHFNPFHPSLVICEKKIYIRWPHEVLTKCPRAVLATSRTWVTCFSGHLCEENLDMSQQVVLSNNSDYSRQMDWIHHVPPTGQDSSRKASSRAFNIRCTRAEVKCSLKGVGANGEPGRNSINAAQTSEMLKWCAVQVDLTFQTSDSSVCQRTCYASCKFRNAVAGSLSDKATIHDDKEPTKERKYTKGPKIISKQKCTGFFQFSTCWCSWKTFLTSFLPQPPVLPNCMIGCAASIYIRIQHASDKLENKESVLCEHKSAPQCTTSCQVAIKVRHQQPASIVIYSHI